jgi:hypothetical protein
MNNIIHQTSLSKLLFLQNTEMRFKDNEIAHEIINDIIKKLIERISTLESQLTEYTKNVDSRLGGLETFATTELVGKNSLQYCPPGTEEYLSLGQTLTDLYSRLNKIENQVK